MSIMSRSPSIYSFFIGIGLSIFIFLSLQIQSSNSANISELRLLKKEKQTSFNHYLGAITRFVVTIEQIVVPNMNYIPSGNFMWGCATQDKHCEEDEQTPGEHRYLPGFYIDHTEVTLAAYILCLDAGECRLDTLTGGTNRLSEYTICPGAIRKHQHDHPINCLNFEEAQTFCEWSNKRLPSEMEWEKAARGDLDIIYPWGNEKASCRFAIIFDRWGRSIAGCGLSTTAPVGSRTLGVSPYQVMDLVGNVSEWTSSQYETYESMRVVRGSSWNQLPNRSRLSDRTPKRMTYSGSDVGFRCALSVPPE